MLHHVLKHEFEEKFLSRVDIHCKYSDFPKKIEKLKDAQITALQYILESKMDQNEDSAETEKKNKINVAEIQSCQ